MSLSFAAFKLKQIKAEKAYLKEALHKHDWGLIATAGDLGVYPSTLRKAITRIGLENTYKTKNPGPGRPK